MRKCLQVLLLLAALSEARAAPFEQQRRCTPQEATEADAMADRLDSWAKVDSAIRRYGHCDDGSIAEGNSEAVARLLVDQWASLPALVRLAKTSPGLRTFILRHVDSTVDTDDLERITWLATNSCPNVASALCRDLKLSASRALTSTGH